MRGQQRKRRVNEPRMLGIILLIVGGAALAKAMLLPLPEWMFSWQILLIVIGILIGIKDGFSHAAWLILVTIGSIFLIREYFPDLIDFKLLWPSALIIAGLFFLLKSRGLKSRKENTGSDELLSKPEERNYWEGSAQSEDFIDSVSFFGGVKKIVVSKDFKGGDITNILGGCQINLKQADIHGRVALEVTQVFGGTEIIVPPNWKIVHNMSAVFGGVEDKRTMQEVIPDPDKVLVLTGTSVFGGIEIRNY